MVADVKSACNNTISTDFLDFHAAINKVDYYSCYEDVNQKAMQFLTLIADKLNSHQSLTTE